MVSNHLNHHKVYQSCCSYNCHYCHSPVIKFGKVGSKQRYRCKMCGKTQLHQYVKRAYRASTNSYIALYVKEDCGIRTISRLLSISANTVIKRIKNIADNITKPAISINRIYELDELKTYVKNKTKECWVAYALDKQTRRNKSNLKMVADTLLLSGCKQIYTDKLEIYRRLIPAKMHITRRFGINKIERKNLTLRTHLKRLNRKTICYSKSAAMLEACLKIYFWHRSCPKFIAYN